MQNGICKYGKWSYLNGQKIVLCTKHNDCICPFRRPCSSCGVKMVENFTDKCKYRVREKQGKIDKQEESNK